MSKRTEKRIIQFLEKNGPSFLGEVVKELKLSYTKGLELINKLYSKGIVKRTYSPLQYKLNSDSE
jgi:DNA-binding Lrp family transcriptional regulator